MSDGWDGMVKIGHRSSRSAFGANNSALEFGLDDLNDMKSIARIET